MIVIIVKLTAVKNRWTALRIRRELSIRSEIDISKGHEFFNRTKFYWYKIKARAPWNEQLVIRGMGSAYSDELALLKAWGEFVERYSFHSSTRTHPKDSITSSGFAAHSSKTKAKNAALFELIERDIFLIVWLLKAPVLKLDASFNSTASWSSSLLNLKSLGFEAETVILGRCMGVIVCATHLYNAESSYVLASASNSVTSCLASLSETATATALGSRSALNVVKELNPSSTPVFHLQKYRNTGVDILKFWNLKAMAIPNYSNFEYKITEHPNAYADNSGFYIFSASSEECQNLFFGETTPQKVNLRRLSTIAGHDVHFENLNLLTHPFY